MKPTPEAATPEADSATPEAPIPEAPVQSPIQALIARMDTHEAEGAAILKDMDTLGLDAKKVKAIRRAEKAAAAAREALDKLMREGA